ncbi:hypothetical protein B0I35DRAFT_98667 [Stachybotrys elegans]|uniref:Uncharacterized protein n=1 Tax=Stachybotrys elegans TaxID=80388 RepID=A0A8K0WMD7_9HYPO|nr:hypothetical protein B0I35DRAFT_98667 [Stachybotrys elegans]
MYLESSTRGIGSVAFESPHPAPAATRILSAGLPHNIHNTGWDNYFSSTHNLEGLVGVTPCQKENHDGVVGLLFQFDDDHRECAGEVRLDSLGKSLDLRRDEGWALVFERRADARPYVSAIHLQHVGPDSDIVGYVNLTCSGELHWLWSPRQCYIMYEGQTSPQPVLWA